MVEILKTDSILITGGTGFLGKWIEKELKEKGYEKVWAIGSQECDLRNQVDTNTFIWQYNPNIIIHAAANVGGIGKNLVESGTLCYENLVMGTNIIEAARQQCNNLKKFVLLSTICSFPKYTPIPFKEEDIWGGYPEETNAGYGLAKKMLMVLLQTYKQQYNFPGITLIPVNLMGEGDSLDLTNNHVIPALILKILKAKHNQEEFVEIWGDGSPSREFLYVKDCAKAIVLAMEKYEKLDPINIGTGKEIKISELVKILVDKIGFSGYIKWDTTKPNGQPRRCLDVSKAEKEFGFVAETNLCEGLDNTIKWIISKIECLKSYYGDVVMHYPIIDVRKKNDKI
jgi:GDP-L-fucose synthase